MSNKEGRIVVIEALDTKDGKVAPITKLLAKLDTKGKILLVVTNKDLMMERATRNVAGLKVVNANYLNVFDVMNSDTIVMTNDALTAVTTWLTSSPRLRSTSGSSK